MRRSRTWIPWAMAAGRAALGPVLAAGAACGWNGLVLAGMVLTALLSDIFDGVLARRWECDTAGVRLFDTLADTFFYGWTAVALLRFAPSVWREHGMLITAVLALEVLHFGFDLAKFGKPASYHSYLAKTWGMVLAPAVIAVFALGRSNVLVPVALWVGMACKVEGLAMSWMLREWRQDVKTLAVAWRLRKERAVARRGRLGWKAAALLGLMVMTASSFAVEGNEVSYVGGTGSITARTFLLATATADSAVIREVAAPCLLVEKRAVQYLEEHDFYTGSMTENSDILIDLGNHKDATTPSGQPLTLNRFSIHKYTVRRYLSPFKAYDDFRLEGHLRLTKAIEGSCNATLRFEFSAFEYVWALGVIDDGYRSKFISNGTLERTYIDSIVDLFTTAKL